MKTKDTITTKHQPSPQSLYLCTLYHVHGYILGSVGPGYDVSTLENEDMALSRNICICVLVYSFVILYIGVTRVGMCLKGFVIGTRFKRTHTHAYTVHWVFSVYQGWPHRGSYTSLARVWQSAWGEKKIWGHVRMRLIVKSVVKYTVEKGHAAGWNQQFVVGLTEMRSRNLGKRCLILRDFQAFAALWMSCILCVATQSSSAWIAWPLKMGMIGCPKMSVNRNQRCVTSQKSEDVMSHFINAWLLPTLVRI